MFGYGHMRDEEIYGGRTPPGYLNPAPFKIPITFLSGELNATWLPVSTERTSDWLVNANEPDLCRRHVIQGHGHLDTFMGPAASTGTHPLMLDQLEKC
jgi:hypothetical protein